MKKHSAEQIVVGVTIDQLGTVVVSEGYQQTLCDTAIELQEGSPYAVDVEHLLAALVMAVRDGKIPRNDPLDRHNPEQLRILSRYIDILFQKYGGKVNPED